MNSPYKQLSLAIALLAVALCVQSCNEQGVQLQKQQTQFILSPAFSDDGRTVEIDLPESAHALISVTGSNGTTVLSDYEVAVMKNGNAYVTDFIELLPGSYSVTDFIILDDEIALYVSPKKDAELTASDALPYNFSVDEQRAASVNISLMQVGDEELRKFGYGSSKAKNNSLSLAVYEKIGGSNALTSATAELRQNRKLIKEISLAAGISNIALDGDPKVPYTLTVYKDNAAKSQTFDIKELRKSIGKGHLQVVLEPALVFAIESYVEEGNEYEEYFDFRMDGTGTVNINWGDGDESNAALPFEISHEYFTGNYKAIVTGDIDQVTDFSGFSYSTIMLGITGLTNLPSLKVYNPSWGAVPIKVDLSNCHELETIAVAKYGAPYEPCDMRTEFKLPVGHNITLFLLDATSFDITREYMSEEELEVMANNIYTNVLDRNIHDGMFLVNPVVAPSSATQAKLDVLVNDYDWTVAFNDDIYYALYSESGRRGRIADADARREEWLRERFKNSQQIIDRAPVAYSAN